jgi:hypothetical protein
MTSSFTIVFITALIFGAILFAVYLFPNIKNTIIQPPRELAQPQQTIIQMPEQRPPIVSVGVGVDGKYAKPPQPLRDWMSMPELPPRGGIATIPINIPTKGLPESFQAIGIIKTQNDVLPLYGRRTAGSTDRWNYYTRTNSYNPVPIPIQSGKKDCMNDIGCNELFSGDNILVEELHGQGTVKIYNYDGPKYIPGLL